MDASTVALIQTLLNGALLGCLFGCVALGLTVKWGLLGVADFFHISLTLIGGYLTYTLVVDAGWNPLLTVLVTAPAFFLVGLGTQFLFVRLKAEIFTTLLITFGLFIVAESVVSLVWSPDLLSMRRALPDWLRGGIRLPEPLERVSVNPVDLLSLGAALVMVVASAVALRRTRHGRALRAVNQDAPVAEVFGIRLVPLAIVTSALAAASAAVAGSLVAIKMPLYPQLPLQWLGIVVVSCLLGGLGRPVGALVAAVVLMMVQNAWSLWFPPPWAPAVAFGVLFLYLALQPLARMSRERLVSRS